MPAFQPLSGVLIPDNLIQLQKKIVCPKKAVVKKDVKFKVVTVMIGLWQKF